MMDQPADNQNRPVEEAENKPTVPVGTILREARERMGMSINEVANQIKFAPRQIEALEANEFGEKPEATFLRGFVRSYGKLLHLDVETLFAALPETRAVTLSAAPEPERMTYPSAQTLQKKQNLVWMSMALLFVLIALGFAISNLKTSDKTDSNKADTVSTVETPVDLPAAEQIMLQPDLAASSVETAVPVAEVTPKEVKVETAVAVKADKPVADKIVADKPIQNKPVVPKPVEPILAPAKKANPEKSVQASVQTAPAATVVAPAKEKEVIPIDTLLGLQPKSAAVSEENANTSSEKTALRIVFGEESWTEVRDGSGKIISSQVNASGSELRLKGNAPFTLSIGNARSVRLYYKGKQVDLAPYIKKYSAVAHLTLE